VKALVHYVLSAFLLLAGAQGQKAAATAAASQPAAKIEVPAESIPLTPDRRYQVRELQYQIDQAQIKIEQLKQQQIQWTNDISVIATDFARVEKVDLNAYELDAVNLRLIRKKLPSGAVTPSAREAAK
jgi:TolA-binding protein